MFLFTLYYLKKKYLVGLCNGENPKNISAGATKHVWKEKKYSTRAETERYDSQHDIEQENDIKLAQILGWGTNATAYISEVQHYN